MATYTIDIDTVCTHQDLADEIGGLNELANLLPDEYAGNSQVMRERALRDTLKALARRTPPIVQSNISDPTDLREAVIYGTLAHLYRIAMTTPDGVQAERHDYFQRRYQAEVLGLNPTLHAAIRGNAFTIQLSRR